jgi:hypothetical protein
VKCDRRSGAFFASPCHPRGLGGGSAGSWPSKTQPLRGRQRALALAEVINEHREIAGDTRGAEKVYPRRAVSPCRERMAGPAHDLGRSLSVHIGRSLRARCSCFRRRFRSLRLRMRATVARRRVIRQPLLGESPARGVDGCASAAPAKCSSFTAIRAVDPGPTLDRNDNAAAANRAAHAGHRQPGWTVGARHESRHRVAGAPPEYARSPERSALDRYKKQVARMGILRKRREPNGAAACAEVAIAKARHLPPMLSLGAPLHPFSIAKTSVTC